MSPAQAFFPPVLKVFTLPSFKGHIKQLARIWGLIVIQLLGLSNSLPPPWTAACQVSLPFTISGSLLKHMSIKLMMPSNHLIPCCPILLLPPVFPNLRIFSNELALCIRWLKYSSFSISPSSEYSVLISFRIDWFDVLAVQVTLKSLLPYHNLKASIFQYSGPHWMTIILSLTVKSQSTWPGDLRPPLTLFTL